MSELALVVLAEMRDNALKAIEYSERGGARWEEDGLSMRSPIACDR